MDITITAKIQIYPDEEQVKLLRSTLQAYRKGCNYISEVLYIEGSQTPGNKIMTMIKLNKITYRDLRDTFGLRSQMAQSVMKTVIAKYKSCKSNGHKFTKVRFKKPEFDLVWNRDYSLVKNLFSVNTLEGRIKVPFETKEMERYFDNSWEFGTAKLIFKKGKFYLHIPVSKEIPEIDLTKVDKILGVDFGINFLSVAFSSNGKTFFFDGHRTKDKRAQFKQTRKSLQQKSTPSARRRLKKIGNRENRYMTDVNHCVSKALVNLAGKNGLIVLEDLTGIRSATEKVRKNRRWYTVSWAFSQLRKMIEYKGQMNECHVIPMDPRYTSQTCPKCDHKEKANRNKKKHIFCCQKCKYRSNDDRIAAMNLHKKGIEYLAGAVLA